MARMAYNIVGSRACKGTTPKSTSDTLVVVHQNNPALIK